MPDREKVIKGLEYCLMHKGCWNDITKCPWCCECMDDDQSLKKAALALLKAQEPRVLTLSEVLDELKEGQYIWVEIKDDEGRLFHSQIDWVNPTDSGDCEYQLFMPGSVLYNVVTDQYSRGWRVWSRQVSWTEMEAVKWDD